MKLQVVLENLNNPCPELDKVFDQLQLRFPVQIEKIALSSSQGQLLARSNNLPTTPGVFFQGKLIASGEITLDKLTQALSNK